jgi:UDP-N-acetylglucosamine enolpyruvyl transferase
MTQAIGETVVEDQIYFDRFSYVPELARLGADIRMEDHGAVIQGPSRLVGASVMSTDLRASVSLVMAAMVASGRSQVLRVYHLDRGYETLESKLNAVGANIQRVSEDA